GARVESRRNGSSRPLSLHELTRPGMRWVEVEASAVESAGRYRDTIESPRTLVLKFNPGLQPDSVRRRYRGIFYSAINRSPVVTDLLIQEMHASNIEPRPRFGVLMVDESPWVIRRAWAREIGVLLSLLLVVVLLGVRALSQLVIGRAFGLRPASWPNAFAVLVGLGSVAWAV